MASSPQFISVPRISFGEITTGQSLRTTNTSANLVTVISGAATGTRILELVIKATGDPTNSIVTLWLDNGITNALFDEFALGDPAAGSNTAVTYRLSTTYSNLILPSDSWSLKAGCTVTPTAGTIAVWAFGGDL